jgi:hypothetical protein
MPKIYEMFGRKISDKSASVVSERKSAYCRFTQDKCDGGGNRHQTKIKLEDSELREFFDEGMSSVIPGICSIACGEDTWVVCPRRLLGFVNKGSEIPAVNHSLHQHERNALIQAGLPRGVELGVWPEVYLQYADENTSINYHFDFVVAPVQRNQSLSWMLSSNDISNTQEIANVSAAARTGGYISGKLSLDEKQDILPDLTSPTIIEVMTASTSGSDKAAGTDIASSFTDAIVGREHNCPGINKRQVWGRMATQLFAKSALAEEWGGKTIWLVQDQLLKNIQLTTKLSLEETRESSGSSINFLSMSYQEGEGGRKTLQLDSFSATDPGLNFQGDGKSTDILLPKVTPNKSTLLMSVLRRKLSAILRL